MAGAPDERPIETAPMAALGGDALHDWSAGAPTPADVHEPTPRSTAEPVEELVGREERAKLRARLISVLWVGLAIWSSFGLVDIATVLGGRGPWWFFLIARLVPALAILFVIAHLRRCLDPSVRLLRFYETAVLTLAVFCLALRCIVLDGWASPQIAGAGLIIMAHAVTLGGPWRRSLVPVVSTAATLPATLGVATLFSPTLAAQLADGDAMASFGIHYSEVVGAAGLALVGGDVVWNLRRQVTEARSIGRYQLRELIASGGMGEIWAAYHAGLRRDVAVKLMQPRVGSDPTAVERFGREVRMLAELTHPNTVRVFDYGATETGIWYYAMELLAGEDLQTIVDRDGALEPARAVRLTTQAAQALAEAHERGIVHRDIKPANLFLIRVAKSEEFVKLIDFGIARKPDNELDLTRTGMVMGTPGYIAPEVLTGGPATPRSDVYALGMVLYVLLTGKLPYSVSTPAEMVRAALEEAPSPPSVACAELDPRIERIVMRCLARDPLARFADAGELAVALRGSGPTAIE